MGKEKKMQPSLLHVPVTKDVVYTPDWLARDLVDHFAPGGVVLDPCAGDGVFLHLLGEGAEWCEIEKGVDFYERTAHADWIIGNPPYSHLLAWLRHSFTLGDNIVYLMPLHRVFASASFLSELLTWGGVAEIRLYGTGTGAGFPFGHALGGIYYKRNYRGDTRWTAV